jgi:hypothetical protein
LYSDNEDGVSLVRAIVCGCVVVVSGGGEGRGGGRKNVQKGRSEGRGEKKEGRKEGRKEVK